MTVDTLKEQKLREMSTEALQQIADVPLPPENKEPSPEFPLGGLVHITGIGQVSLKRIRAILDERREAA